MSPVPDLLIAAAATAALAVVLRQLLPLIWHDALLAAALITAALIITYHAA